MASKKKIEEVTKQEPIIYIGPSIPNYIKQYTIYREGLPRNLDELKQLSEQITCLFVEVSKFKEFKEKLKDHTSYLSVVYTRLEQSKGVDK